MEVALDALLAGDLPGFSTVRHLLESPGGCDDVSAARAVGQ
jgi:hypothetical protein